MKDDPQKIECPDEAFRRVVNGEDPVMIAGLCQIGPLFERRDWVAAITAVGIVLAAVPSPQFDRLHKLCSLLLDMVNADRQRHWEDWFGMT